jgi:hypothetical protein
MYGKKIINAFSWSDFFVFVLFPALGFALTILWLNQQRWLNGVWFHFETDKHALVSFCEQSNMNKVVRQPVNTFSNIVYMIVGIIILKRSSQSRFDETPISTNADLPVINYRRILGLVILYVFLVSAFYYLSLISIALKLDYSGVYLIALFPLMYFAFRSYGLYSEIPPTRIKQQRVARVLFILFVTIWVGLSVFLPAGAVSIITVVIIFNCAAIAFIVNNGHRRVQGRRYLLFSTFFVLLATAWFGLDRFKLLCSAQSYFQPHSLWNVFIGVSAFYFYQYMCIDLRCKSNSPVNK